MLKTVKVPPEFVDIFAKAEKIVGDFFSKIEMDPSQGVIHIAGDRYLLMRGESIFSTLRDNMVSQFGEAVTDSFLYDLAKTIGKSDAKRFAEKLGLKDPIAKLSAGPVHFSHAGWALVEILPESVPSADDNYLLVYNHPNTFESELYVSQGKKPDKPVCLFSAGYSAGWCSYSFGLDLDAKEIMCIAKGDSDCRFVMAPSGKLDKKVADYIKGI